jgi:hypothetical protein
MNLYRVFLGTAIARRFGVQSPTDFTDGIISAVPRSAAMGAILVTATAPNQAAASAPAAAQRPSLQLTAAAASSSQINLIWTGVPDPNATYSIFRGPSSGNEDMNNPITDGLDALSYSDEQLNSNTQYFYLVQAFDAKDNPIATSNEAAATTIRN